MKLDEVKFKHTIKSPQGHASGLQSDTAYFSGKTFDLDYDPASGLVTVMVPKTGKSKSVHVSNVQEMVIAHAPAANPTPINKFAPKNKVV